MSPTDRENTVYVGGVRADCTKELNRRIGWAYDRGAAREIKPLTKHATKRRLGQALLLLAAPAFIGCDGDNMFSLSPAGLLGKSDSTTRTLPICTEPPAAPSLVKGLLEAVNSEREKHGLRPVKLDTTLTQVAEFYACRMIEGRFFGHQDPFDGSTVDTRAVNFGYAYRKVGENLAAGHNTVAEVMAHWMRSPGHRANILDPAFKDLGIAVRQGGEFGVYWVQEFGRPITAPPVRSAEPASEEPAATMPALPLDAPLVEILDEATIM